MTRGTALSTRWASLPYSGTGAGDLPPPGSVYAAVLPFRRSATVRMPAATACSAHCRALRWKRCRQGAPQKVCREPPLRRALKGFPHHRQAGEGSVTTAPRARWP